MFWFGTIMNQHQAKCSFCSFYMGLHTSNDSMGDKFVFLYVIHMKYDYVYSLFFMYKADKHVINWRRSHLNDVTESWSQEHLICSPIHLSIIGFLVFTFLKSSTIAVNSMCLNCMIWWANLHKNTPQSKSFICVGPDRWWSLLIVDMMRSLISKTYTETWIFFMCMPICPLVLTFYFAYL